MSEMTKIEWAFAFALFAGSFLGTSIVKGFGIFFGLCVIILVIDGAADKIAQSLEKP